MSKRFMCILVVTALVISSVYIFVCKSQNDFERKLALVRRSEVCYEIYFSEMISEYAQIRTKIADNSDSYLEGDIYKESYNINYNFLSFLNDSYLCDLLDFVSPIEQNFLVNDEPDNNHKLIRKESMNLFKEVNLKDFKTEDKEKIIEAMENQMNFISLINERLISLMRNKKNIDALYSSLEIEKKNSVKIFKDALVDIQSSDIEELTVYLETKALRVMASHQEKEAEELYYLMKKIGSENYSSVTEIMSSKYFKRIEELLDEIERNDNQN